MILKSSFDPIETKLFAVLKYILSLDWGSPRIAVRKIPQKHASDSHVQKCVALGFSGLFLHYVRKRPPNKLLGPILVQVLVNDLVAETLIQTSNIFMAIIFQDDMLYPPLFSESLPLGLVYHHASDLLFVFVFELCPHNPDILLRDLPAQG